MNLEARRKEANACWDKLSRGDRPLVFVGSATCGLAAGVSDLQGFLNSELERLKLDVDVIPTGCIGMCFAEPLVDVKLPDQPRVCYAKVDRKTLTRILEQHVAGGKPLADLALGTLGDEEIAGIPKLFDLAVLKPQVRIALRNCGIINPADFNHYLARDGYLGLQRALSMNPDEVIEEVIASGLRGRGGGGFPTGLKWRFCRSSPGQDKYLICNADEGDPGAFMDRSLLEGDPHAVLEGMCIAAYAIGAEHGYVYIRAEYPLAITRLVQALQQMKEANLLGENILGSDFSFDIRIKEGAGAFVCGEETALIASIEGERGMPRSRPPFPAVKGLFGKPSNINNVETFANVASILREGSKWYASFGTEKSKGTKTFALAGKIRNPGLIEVPMGITLGDVVEKIGGGILGAGQFKAAQTGGPSGGCLPIQFLNTPIDYESLAQAGSIMGSGGLVVTDQSTCMVDLSKYFLTFTQNESCGKCTPCRVGTREMLTILEKITEGRGEPEDLVLLEQLGLAIRKASLCGLGQTAPNPVLTTLKYFREEYEEHVNLKKCRAKVCKAMLTFTVLAETCTGCTLCAKKCPTGAVTGEKKQAHSIDQNACVQCGVCAEVCRFDAIHVE